MTAVGDRRPIPIMETYGNVADMIISLPPRGVDGTGTQQRHNQGMPFGTRGGVSRRAHLPRPMANTNCRSATSRSRAKCRTWNSNKPSSRCSTARSSIRTEIGGEEDHKWIDQILDDAVAQINERLKNIRFHATAGQHIVTVTFLQRSMAESDERTGIAALEGGQDRVHAVHALQVRGPLEVTGMGESRKPAENFRVLSARDRRGIGLRRADPRTTWPRAHSAVR